MENIRYIEVKTRLYCEKCNHTLGYDFYKRDTYTDKVIDYKSPSHKLTFCPFCGEPLIKELSEALDEYRSQENVKNR